EVEVIDANVDRFLNHLWLFVHQLGWDPPTEESSRPSTPCPDRPRADTGLQQRLDDGAAHSLIEVTFIVQLKDGYEDPPLCVDGEQPLFVALSRYPLTCCFLVGAAHVSQGLVGDRTFVLEKSLADFTAADRLTLGRPRHDLRIVDVVLVDLFAQRVSPGDFEPFVLLVESDGALHLVATQALEIHLLIRVHRLMCLCGHGGLPFLLSSVALVELPQHSIQLLHFPPNTPVLGAAWTGSKYSKRRLKCSAKTSGRSLMSMRWDGSPASARGNETPRVPTSSR